MAARHRAKGPNGHQLPCVTASLHIGWCCECFMTTLHVPQHNINPCVIAHRFYTLEVVHARLDLAKNS